jgi:hypothetical protein
MKKAQKYIRSINLFNIDLSETESFNKLCNYYNKDKFKVINALQCRLNTSFSKKNNFYKVWINFTDTKSNINIKHELITNF